MQRRSIVQTSTLIILLSILTILAQFTTYYFIEAKIIIWGISCLISFICCHIILEQTTTYEACFNYSLLSLFMSLMIIVITYFGNDQSFLPYSEAMLGIAVINWAAPMLHCFFRNLFDYGTRIDDFNLFYRNSSILFFLSYLAVLIYAAFAKDAFPSAYRAASETANWIPFELIATQIEEYLFEQIPLSDIIIYLLFRIIFYIPYGFYIGLILRRKSRLPRFLALLLLPVVVELIQYFVISYRCDIDDIIYALIGGVLGLLLFLLLNVIFRGVSGKDFLMKDSDYRYSGGALHF